MSAPARPYVSTDRRAMLAKIHMAGKELGLQDDARRDVLERVTGHRSAADCTDAQLDEAVAEFKRLGWKPRVAGRPVEGPAKAVRRPAAHPMAGKARALWLSLWQLGVIRDPKEAALEAFAKRQLRVDALAWADQSQGFRLIEALKAMAERNGWSQDLTHVKPARQVWALKARLVNRQLEILGRPAASTGEMTEKALDAMAAGLGVEIRAKAALGGLPE